VRVGIAHHFGWAVAVTASAGHVVMDRRRIELIEPGMPTAPIEHEAKSLDDGAAARMVAEVRASALRATSASLDELADSLPEPVVSMSLRAWPLDFPDDIVAQRRPPQESRADSVMYCRVLAECAHVRGWQVHLFDAKAVEAQAGRSSATEPAMCSTDRGQCLVRRGPGTTGSRSPPRSLPGDDLASSPHANLQFSKHVTSSETDWRRRLPGTARRTSPLPYARPR
jgi:hypothetical protein